jgi:hypothetical protein
VTLHQADTARTRPPARSAEQYSHGHADRPGNPDRNAKDRVGMIKLPSAPCGAGPPLVRAVRSRPRMRDGRKSI